MTPELKEKWAAALESGKYKQGYGTLKTSDNKYCCLGVLVAVVGGVWKGKQAYVNDVWVGADSLVETFRQEFDMAFVDVGNLIRMNDHDHAPFTEIAKVVRKLP